MVGQSKTPAAKRAQARVSIEQTITNVLKVIQEVYEFYGFRSEGYSLRKTAAHWVQAAQVAGWMAWTKYKLAAFFAVQLEQKELPASPVPGSTDAPDVLLGGVAYRWLRSFLREADLDTRTSFLASILYAKYGMPLPDQEECVKACLQTSKFLTADHPELRSLSHLPTVEQVEGKRVHFESAPQVFPNPAKGSDHLYPEFKENGPVGQLSKIVKENPMAWGSAYFDHAPHHLVRLLTQDDIVAQLERTVDELFPPIDNALDARRLWEEEVRPLHPRFPSTNGNYNRGRMAGGAVGDVHSVAKEVGLTDRHDNLVSGRWASAAAVQRARKGLRKAERGNEPPRDASEDEQMAHADEHRVDLPYTKAQRKAAAYEIMDFNVGRLTADPEDSGPLEPEDPENEDVIDDFRPVGPPLEFTPASTEGLVFLVDDSKLTEKSNKLWTEVQRRAMAEEPLVEPVGLAEALKVRVISKGPPLTYSALKPIQEYLHSKLRRHPCFALIGEEIHAGHVHYRMGRLLADDMFYVSGDYKASTDNLDPLVSEVIARRISRNLQFPAQYEELFVRSLTQHVFVDSDGVRSEQRWGQLMGSITSFPVLCIANAAMSRWAIEYGLRQATTLRNASLMINGDDVLLKTNVWGWYAWKSLTAAVGLQPSVGKVYTSRWYLNMNSTSFRRRGPDETFDIVETPDRDDPLLTHKTESPFTRIPFINLRLMGENKRSMAFGDMGTKEMPLGARARELMRTCPFGLRERVWKKFLNKNWKRLSSVRVPWYMPEWLGGLGLPWMLNTSVDDVDDVHIIENYGPTDCDLRKAHGIRLGWSRKRPLKATPLASWAVHELVGQLLPVLPRETTKPVDTTGFDRLYGRLACETLLRADSVDQLQLDRKATGQRVLRHNERLWSGAPYCSPLSLKECWPRQTFTYLPVMFLT